MNREVLFGRYDALPKLIQNSINSEAKIALFNYDYGLDITFLYAAFIVAEFAVLYILYIIL